MKKKYLEPTAEVVALEAEQELLIHSVTSGDLDLEFGGDDDDGIYEPY